MQLLRFNDIIINMETVIQPPTIDQNIESLKAIIESQAAQIAKMEALIKHYEERFKLEQRRRFGSSSEASPNQIRFEELFNEAEDQADPTLPEPTYDQATYKRKKRIGKRKDDLSALPVERVEYELAESERACPECGEIMGDIGVTVRDELEIIPARVVHKEHAVHAYACANCNKNNDRTPVTRAESPMPLIPGSLASPSAVAHIASQKFVNGIPLYRSERGLSYDGVELSRQTMANWLIYCARNYLMVIYTLLASILLKGDVIHADETSVQVLREPGRKAQTKSYEWLYRTGRCSEHPIVIYEYHETRQHEHAKNFLEGFKGFIHADGYQAYHNLSADVTVVGCWSHARRPWENLYKTLPEDKRDGSNAERGLVYCNLLFALEDEFRDLGPEERLKKRLEFSKPVSDDFFNWVDSLGALPKSLLGDAITYMRNQRKYLENIYLDGRLEISNNAAERSIKPFVQGRKQWLFSCTPNGAKSSSIYYSIFETAKENRLNPYQYVKYLLESLPSAKLSGLESLLPWSKSLPDCCRVPDTPSNTRPKRRKLYNEKGRLHQALLKLREKYFDKTPK